MTMTL